MTTPNMKCGFCNSDMFVAGTAGQGIGYIMECHCGFRKHWYYPKGDSRRDDDAPAQRFNPDNY